MEGLNHEDQRQQAYLELLICTTSCRLVEESRSNVTHETAELLKQAMLRIAYLKRDKYAEMTSLEEAKRAAGFLRTVSAVDSFETVQSEWKTLDDEFDAFISRLKKYPSSNNSAKSLAENFKIFRAEATKMYIQILAEKVEGQFIRSLSNFRGSIESLDLPTEEKKKIFSELVDPSVGEYMNSPVYLNNRLYDAKTLVSHVSSKTNNEPQNWSRFLPLCDPFSTQEITPLDLRPVSSEKLLEWEKLIKQYTPSTQIGRAHV